MCRCAQTQTLLFNFTLKFHYTLMYPVDLSGDKMLQCKLNRFRDVLDIYRTAYRELSKGIIQFIYLVEDKTFVGVQIDGFLDAKNPIGAILVQGVESVQHGVELAIIVNY